MSRLGNVDCFDIEHNTLLLIWPGMDYLEDHYHNNLCLAYMNKDLIVAKFVEPTAVVVEHNIVVVEDHMPVADVVVEEKPIEDIVEMKNEH